MLITLVETIEIAVCCFLVLFALMQPGRGGIGPAFGGGASQQVFGPHGAGKILAIATAICAAIFVIGTVLLAWLSSH